MSKGKEHYQVSTTHCTWVTSSGTTFFSRQKGVTDTGIAYWPQGKCGGGQKYENIDPFPFSTSKLEDLRQTLRFWSYNMMLMRIRYNSRCSVQMFDIFLRLLPVDSKSDFGPWELGFPQHIHSTRMALFAKWYTIHFWYNDNYRNNDVVYAWVSW